MTAAMTDRHCHLEQTVNNVASGHQELCRRLEMLEGKFATAAFSGSSTKTSDGDPNPRPAIVVGGWDSDQSAEDTLRRVKQHLSELRCDLDLAEAFVPGIRRGFAIVPIAARSGEPTADFRRRVPDALQAVREAKVITGERPQRGRTIMWAAMSESPERRRRAQFARKVKRLILETSGDRRLLEVEFGTVNVWYAKTEIIASAVITAPPDADKAGAGWLSISALAQRMGTTGSV